MRSTRSPRRATAGQTRRPHLPLQPDHDRTAGRRSRNAKPCSKRCSTPASWATMSARVLEEERVTPPAELTVAVHYSEEALVEMRILCEARGERPAGARSDCCSRDKRPAARRRGWSRSPAFRRRPNFLSTGRASTSAAKKKCSMRWAARSAATNSLSRNPRMKRTPAFRVRTRTSASIPPPANGASSTTAVRSAPRLFRDGRRIDVPAHASRGVALQPGRRNLSGTGAAAV